MRKYLLSLGVLSCLLFGCSSDDSSKGDEQSSPTTPPGDTPTTPISTDKLTAEKSEITLYYDIPREIRLFYKSGIELKIVGTNNCVNFLTDPLVIGADGVAHLKMQAKLFSCEDGRTVKVCDAQDDQNCTEFTVYTTSNENKIDANHNLMIDDYEIYTDDALFPASEYASGKCDSFCHDDANCDDFCDSALGYRCSTRCTSDDQCIKYKLDGKFEPMICRADGRCAFPSFKAVYNIRKDNTTLTFGGKPANENVTIDWGDGNVEKVPTTVDNNLSHTYQKSGQYKILLTGDFLNWTAGCSDNVELFDIYQFGPIGLGYQESTEQGSFWNCFSFNKISAKDIPDASKLKDMSYMFAGAGEMAFNQASVGLWDTSNVTAMASTFLNANKFNQDIGRWNTSRVKSLSGMFNSAINFNKNIDCWNVSKVTDISGLFIYTQRFNQNLEHWNLEKVIKHDHVIDDMDSHDGDLSIKNYCIIKSKVRYEDIGRDNQACRYEYSHNTMCKNDTWKTLVSNCINQYLGEAKPGITEDNVTCAHLRECYRNGID